MPSLVRGLRHRATGATGASSTAHSAAPRRAWQHAVAAPLLHRPYSARATVRTRSEYSMRVAPVFAMQFGATRNTGHLLAVCDEMGWVTLMDARVLEDEGQRAMEVSRSSGVRQTPYIGDGGLSAGTFFGGVGGAGGHEGAELRGGAGVGGRRLARLQLRDEESSALRRGGHRRLVIQHLRTCHFRH